MRYPADPPRVEEIVAVMRAAGGGVNGARIRQVLWRGLRIQEALDLHERDLDPRGGGLLVRRGKGGRRREVGVDEWAWEHLTPWINQRLGLPLGPLFCIIDGPHAGGRGRKPAPAPSRVVSQVRRGCGGGSRLTSSVMLTSSRWRARGFHSM